MLLGSQGGFLPPYFSWFATSTCLHPTCIPPQPLLAPQTPGIPPWHQWETVSFISKVTADFFKNAWKKRFDVSLLLKELHNFVQ